MSILERLEKMVDLLRGTRAPTKNGINAQTLDIATQYNASLRNHFREEIPNHLDITEIAKNETCPDAQLLTQARKEMDQLTGDIARLKAELQSLNV